MELPEAWMGCNSNYVTWIEINIKCESNQIELVEKSKSNPVINSESDQVKTVWSNEVRYGGQRKTSNANYSAHVRYMWGEMSGLFMWHKCDCGDLYIIGYYDGLDIDVYIYCISLKQEDSMWRGCEVGP